MHLGRHFIPSLSPRLSHRPLTLRRPLVNSSFIAPGADSLRRASLPILDTKLNRSRRAFASTLILMAPKKSSASPKKDSGVSKTKGGRPIPPRSKAATALAERKMKQLGGPAKTTPYPSFSSPTEAECEAVVQALEKEHGKPPQRGQYRFEDDEEGAEPTDRGIADGVLDAVIRCILTLNTNARVGPSAPVVLQSALADRPLLFDRITASTSAPLTTGSAIPTTRQSKKRGSKTSLTRLGRAAWPTSKAR